MKKKSFTLKILKKDLQTAEFTDCMDCPIARAIKRLGGNFDGMMSGVDADNLDFMYKGHTFTIGTLKYQKLSDRVQAIMNGDKEPKTFSIKLNATVLK